MIMNKKTSPLKDKPLRLAGQSLQEEIDKIINDKALNYMLAPVFFISLVIYEWLRYIQDSVPSPKSIFTLALLAIAATIFSAFKIIKFRTKVKNMRLGLDGEKAVGQELEKLRTQGCMVYHDIVGDNFNIDHVVVSDKGIFLIETKTYSKPNLVNPKVRYEKGSLTIDGLGDMSKIITQVKASSTWLKRTLEESTGKTFLIKPVILFPGWYVESPNDSEIWVLEPKQFPYYIGKKKEIVSLEDKKLAAYHLSRYIRTL
jgi:Nuclease-related domain